MIYINKALIFSVEEFSTFDGPGIRTTVFLKGCPLRCCWCHNPEGQRFENEIIKAQNGCIGCGECVKEKGIVTAESIKKCPNKLLRLCGEIFTPEELVAKLKPNFDVLKLSGGGITFSGGEPLSHSAFLIECLKLLKGKIHTAIQTSGYCNIEEFKEILNLADFFLFDIKIVDEHEHIRYTTVSNEYILENFKILCESGKNFIVRTPLIPTVTDTVKNITDIAVLLKNHNVSKIELLPYNKAAGSKYKSVGKVFSPCYDEDVPSNPHFEIFEKYGINARIL